MWWEDDHIADISGRGTAGNKYVALNIAAIQLMYIRNLLWARGSFYIMTRYKLIQDNPAETDLADGINTNLMEVMRLLMESETVLECPASIDHVGGSLGLRTSDRAVSNRYVELSNMARAERTIGSWAAEPCENAKS